jgi:hypothetical protein
LHFLDVVASEHSSRRGDTKLPGQDSNLDKENQKTFHSQRKSIAPSDSRSDQSRFVRRLAQILEDHPELARLAEAWPRLPLALRAGILAMIGAAAPENGQEAGS